MGKFILPLAMVLFIFIGCFHEHKHQHAADGNELEAITYTRYTDKTELFVEFKPLVVGKEGRFATHLTVLGSSFKPLQEGLITLLMEGNGKKVSATATAPQMPGLFILNVSPDMTGLVRITFNIQTKTGNDQVILDSVMVYHDEKSAFAGQAEGITTNDISYLKEQSWKVEFENMPVIRQPFYDIIKTSGQILSAPGDEFLVTAKIDGIVLFSENKSFIGSSVQAGSILFTISGGDLTEGNIDTMIKEARERFEKAEKDFIRARELVKDKIVSEKEYQQVRLDFEMARTRFNSLSKNYSVKGQTISSPVSGFIKSILVSEGQFVEAGKTLAVLSQNKNLVLQANISQRYFNSLSAITSANFRTTESEAVYSTEQLNGKIISYGKSATTDSPFIPVIFKIENSVNLIPGSVTEIYLKTAPVPDALVIPVSALMEEMGNFFVYVQTAGESFQKRQVITGASDGIKIQLISGVSEGERIVTKGAYQIKLSTSTGTVPAHGHEH